MRTMAEKTVVWPVSDSAVTVIVPAVGELAVEHGGQLAGLADGVELLAGEAVDADRVGVLAGLELQRQDAHADQVGAVDALVALGDDEADAEQPRALRRPVARGAGAVLLAGEDAERDRAVGVLDRGVVDATSAGRRGRAG